MILPSLAVTTALRCSSFSSRSARGSAAQLERPARAGPPEAERAKDPRLSAVRRGDARRIMRIPLDDLRAAAACRLDRPGEQRLSDPTPAMRTADEEAQHRPGPCVRYARHGARALELQERLTRGDRAPADREVTVISENADRHAV